MRHALQSAPITDPVLIGHFYRQAVYDHSRTLDVNNDGLPELLTGANGDDAVAMLGVYGWNGSELREAAVLTDKT